jgi:phosphatidylglycerophosphate synthase
MDILNIPNAISVAGFALVADGARRMDTPIGLAEVVAGRTLDLADGAVARATGQTTEFGAGLDAALDKAGVGLIIYHGWRKGIVPRAACIGIVAQNMANVVATGLAKQRHPDKPLRPSTAGKYAMALQSVALGAYAGAKVLEKNHPALSRTARLTGHVTALAGISLGLKATLDYFRRARD